MSTTTETNRARSRRLRGAVPDKRSAILDAALGVFALRGVHGVAVPEISRAARVATGSIYRYFPSKEALVNELYRREKVALHAHLYDGLELGGPDQRAIFDEFWLRMVSFVRDRPNAYRFLEMQDHRSYLDEESQALERRLLSPIVRRIRELQKRGVYRSDVRDRVLMAMTWGAFVNLIKAERDGLLSLKTSDVAAARELCWQMYTGGR